MTTTKLGKLSAESEIITSSDFNSIELSDINDNQISDYVDNVKFDTTIGKIDDVLEHMLGNED